MCGIIGFSGRGGVRTIITRGLKDLEYRGYDSCGFTLSCGNQLLTKKEEGPGRIEKLTAHLPDFSRKLCMVVAHTRWATHGKISKENTHPQLDCSGSISIVHNGIIENHKSLRSTLEAKGHKFLSATDTESAVHLIEEHSNHSDFLTAVFSALPELQGEFAIGILGGNPRRVLGARNGSPLIATLKDGNLFFASDVKPLLRYNNSITFLDDGEAVVAEGPKISFLNFRTGEEIKKKPQCVRVDSYPEQADAKSDFMLKEINEQPEAILRAYDWFMDVFAREFRNTPFRPDNITILGCGTSWHSGLLGDYLFNSIANIPVKVEYASEFRYKKTAFSGNSLVIAISQSGETADTLGAIRKIRGKVPVLSICNVENSSLLKLSDMIILNKAGTEIGVASTKAFTSQVIMLYLFAVLLRSGNGRLSGDILSDAGVRIRELSEKLREILDEQNISKVFAGKISEKNNAVFFGRGLQYPAAMEGALKLKEVSYIHAEGYPAAEMKHGPLALVDENMPVIFLAAKDRLYPKILGNMEEIKTRGGVIFAVTDCDNPELRSITDNVLQVPCIKEKFLLPALTAVPLQLLAYYAARLRGCDADRPRNLAKSVTVE